jgi:predicted outer membrane protein
MSRLIMVAAASLLAVVLTGCGDKDAKPADANATATPAAAAPANSTEQPAGDAAQQQGH